MSKWFIYFRPGWYDIYIGVVRDSPQTKRGTKTTLRTRFNIISYILVQLGWDAIHTYFYWRAGGRATGNKPGSPRNRARHHGNVTQPSFIRMISYNRDQYIQTPILVYLNTLFITCISINRSAFFGLRMDYQKTHGVSVEQSESSLQITAVRRKLPQEKQALQNTWYTNTPSSKMSWEKKKRSHSNVLF